MEKSGATPSCNYKKLNWSETKSNMICVGLALIRVIGRSQDTVLCQCMSSAPNFDGHGINGRLIRSRLLFEMQVHALI